MTPRYGRCERGKRLIAHTPFGHWKTTTFLAALRYDGVTAPCVFDGPINGARFLAYVEQMLVPTLSPGEIVLWTISVPINAPAFGKPSKPRVRRCASCQPTARTSIPSSRSSPSSKTHCAKWHAEPSMHSGTQSELPSMTFPQKNASTIFAMPDMGPPNQDTKPQNDHAGADLDAVEEVHDVLVGHANAAGRSFAVHSSRGCGKASRQDTWHARRADFPAPPGMKR